MTESFRSLAHRVTLAVGTWQFFLISLATSMPRGSVGSGDGSLSAPIRRTLAPIVVASVIASGCALSSGTLGGREKCWPPDPPRAASIWRGILRVDPSGARLETPEGEVIPLAPGALQTSVDAAGVGALVSGSDVVARSGDDVTLFGGAGADGFLVVCAVEEHHSEG